MVNGMNKESEDSNEKTNNGSETSEEKTNNRSVPGLIPPARKIFQNLICGIGIGAGAILPGVSGVVLCVVFGVYRHLMDLIAHPFLTLRRQWKMFLPIGIGWVIGFFAFAWVIQWIFSISEMFATFFFMGLILGTVPSLFKEAGKEGRTAGSFVSMILSGVLLLGIMMLLKFGFKITVTPNLFWYCFAGVIWGISFVIPGMTSSPVLMAFHLYKPMMDGLTRLDYRILIPWVICMGITIVVLGRIIGKFFDRKYNIAYHAVVGLTVASTLSVFPASYQQIVWQLPLGLFIAAVGFVIAYFSEKLEVFKVSEAEKSADET